MRDFFIHSLYLVLLCVPSFCKSQEIDPKRFSMRDFTSQSIPIFSTYDHIVSFFGDPNFVKDSYSLEYIGDTIRKKHPYRGIYYYAKDIAYRMVGDSVALMSILFKGDFAKDTILYNGYSLCRTTTMDCVADMLGISEEERQVVFFPVMDADWGGGFASHELMYFGTAFEGRGSVDFYFDERGCLIALYFTVPNGSLVYSDW